MGFRATLNRRKFCKNRRKRRYFYIYINKIIYGCLWIWNFYSRVQLYISRVSEARSFISIRARTYTNYSRRDAPEACLISLHTPFTFFLFISTVSYSVKAYGSDTETKNILSIAVMIEGEDDAETKFKYLTNKATEGYEIFIMLSAGGGGGDFGGYQRTCLWIRFVV